MVRCCPLLSLVWWYHALVLFMCQVLLFLFVQWQTWLLLVSTFTCLVVPARYVYLICQRIPAWWCQPGMLSSSVNVYLPGSASQVCLPHLSTFTCLAVPARYVYLVCQRIPAWWCQPGMFTSSVNVYLPDSSSQVCLARLSYWVCLYSP